MKPEFKCGPWGPDGGAEGEEMSEEWREQMLMVHQLLQLVEQWLAASSPNAARAAFSIRASVRQREQHMAVQTRGGGGETESAKTSGFGFFPKFLHARKK